MVSYKELGLVNTREMFAKAIKGGYAIPAFNFNNMEQLQAIIKAAAETKSPVILQVSKGARNYANQTLLHGTGCCRVRKGTGLGASADLLAPRPRRQLRTLQILRGLRFLQRDDRRFFSAL